MSANLLRIWRKCGLVCLLLQRRSGVPGAMSPHRGMSHLMSVKPRGLLLARSTIPIPMKFLVPSAAGRGSVPRTSITSKSATVSSPPQTERFTRAPSTATPIPPRASPVVKTSMTTMPPAWPVSTAVCSNTFSGATTTPSLSITSTQGSNTRAVLMTSVKAPSPESSKRMTWNVSTTPTAAAAKHVRMKASASPPAFPPAPHAHNALGLPWAAFCAQDAFSSSS